MLKLPWVHKPQIGWWRDQPFLIAYHGTHERNIDIIGKTGISKLDEKTGMVSITFDPNTAHGYAAMSGAGGEANFHSSAKPVHTPETDRAVIKMRLPLSFVLSNMNPDLRGNLPEQVLNLKEKSRYIAAKKKNITDGVYYQLSEIRLKVIIPPRYILGYMKKK